MVRVCTYCCKKTKKYKCCDRDTFPIDSRIKLGSIVKLSKQSIDDFYGTNEWVDMFYTNDFDLSSESFVDFVSVYLGFTMGDRFAVVIGSGSDEATAKVEFFVKETGEWRVGYYLISSLDYVG